MKIQDLNKRTICILGYGKEGKAMVAALETYAPECEITIADKNENIAKENETHWFQIGTGWLHNLEKFDYIIKSPGIPPLPELAVYHAKTITPTQIFFDSIKDSKATVIGVTGSKGKSTTSSLIAAILKEDGRDVHLVGNIGEPAILHIADAKKDAIFVLEMSSYQLMDLQTSPHIAVMTSFFPEHLDYHGSLAAYLEAKKHIARFQTPQDSIFFCTNFSGCIDVAKEGEGKKVPFSEADSPVSLEEINLIGEHNLSNIAGAYKVCESLGVHPDVAVRAIKAFKGLPHRLQFLGTKDGIDWVDDAISTTPESAIAAINALGEKVSTIILGGQDRGIEFDLLLKKIKQTSIKDVITFADGIGKEMLKETDFEKYIAQFIQKNFPKLTLTSQKKIGDFTPDFFIKDLNLVIEVKMRESAKLNDYANYFQKIGNNFIGISSEGDLPALKEKIQKLQSSVTKMENIMQGAMMNVATWHVANDMKSAVSIAKEVTPHGKICLLSTASPSYNMFKNFEDKGEQFQKYIWQS